jgi:uncharacterized protein
MHEIHGGRTVGRVVGCWRYPVKSMAPEALAEADVSWFGVAGDRRWAFVRAGAVQSGFPWFTLRDHGRLGLYRPRFVEPSRPDRSTTVVRTPSGVELDVADPALRAELSPEGLQVIRQDRGVFDTFPLSLITTRTLASLSASVAMPLDVDRFRPNFLIEADDDVPFPEDDWVGGVLRVGTLRMRVDKRDGRCVVITIDPQTGARTPEVLRAVAQERQGCLGVYGTTVEPGQVAVGDPVRLEHRA